MKTLPISHTLTFAAQERSIMLDPLDAWVMRDTFGKTYDAKHNDFRTKWEW